MSENLFTDILPIEESIAIWLDGGLTYEEELQLMGTMAENPILSEVMESLDNVDAYYEDMVEKGFDLPSELVFDFDLPNVEVVFDEELESSLLMDRNPADEWMRELECSVEEESEENNDNSVCEEDSGDMNLSQTDWEEVSL